ncbi:hypothetical protein SCUCBS95973_006620 [Sporothrix curviconia]|uniref:Rhodopsin domain-containing protein n=1 Tax=Sporothrix curviconia TaxID=1260050 RepID=A0ABP0C6M3_9PEZI
MALFAIQVPAVICLALRLFGRLTQAARLAIDDYLVILLTPVFVVFLVVGQYAAAIGFGVDIWTLSPDKIVRSMKAFYIDELLYLAILALVKLSVLFLYLRVFAPQAPPATRAARRYRKHYRGFRVAVWVITAFVALPSLVFLLLDAFQCRPVDTIWAQRTSTTAPPPPGTSPSFSCLNVRALAYVASSFGLAQDAAILVLPWPMLLHLRQSFVPSPASPTPTTKGATAAMVTAMAMFSLGVFVLATSCIRLHFLVHFNEASVNLTWENTDSLIWSGLEVSVSVIVMSLPTVRMLGQRAWRSWRAKRNAW